jgi:hypothetical protein
LSFRCNGEKKNILIQDAKLVHMLKAAFCGGCGMYMCNNDPNWQPYPYVQSIAFVGARETRKKHYLTILYVSCLHGAKMVL